MSTRIRAGLVGCGRIGYGFDLDPKRSGVWTLAGAFHASERADFVSACDAVEEKRLECVGKFPAEPVEQLDELLDQELDVIAVAVRDESHASVLSAILEHPKRPKVVWMEKPFTGDFKTARLLVARAEALGVAIHVDYVRRFTELFDKLKELENVKSVTTWYARGLLLNGSHYVDFCLGLFGRPMDVHVLSEQHFSLVYPDFVATFSEFNPGYNMGDTHIFGEGYYYRVPPVQTALYRQVAVESKIYSEHYDLGPVEEIACHYDPMVRQVEVIAECIEAGEYGRLNNGLATLEVLDAVRNVTDFQP